MVRVVKKRPPTLVITLAWADTISTRNSLLIDSMISPWIRNCKTKECPLNHTIVLQIFSCAKTILNPEENYLIEQAETEGESLDGDDNIRVAGDDNYDIETGDTAVTGAMNIVEYSSCHDTHLYQTVLITPLLSVCRNRDSVTLKTKKF